MPYENLEDAKQAALELMSNTTENGAETETAAGTETDGAGLENQPDNTANAAAAQTEEAINTAETAAGVIEDANRQIGEMQQENESLKNAIKQMNDIQEEKIEQLTVPILDIDGMAFDDEDTRHAKYEQYAKDMMNYARQNIMDELKPIIDDIKSEKTQRLKSNIISELARTPEFSDINGSVDRIEAIICQNPNLFNENVPLDEQYVIAGMILKGLDSASHETHEPTADELMNYYRSNNVFKQAVEKERISQLNGQQVPPLSPGTGTGSVAPNIEKKPETISEATDLWRKLLGNR